MKGTLEYTVLAHRYTARFPMLTYLGTQVNFWIIANIVLLTVMHLEALVINQTHNISIAGRFESMFLIALIFGTIQGMVMGLTGYYFDRSVFKNLSLGRVIFLKALISLTVLFIILMLLRYVLFDLLISSELSVRGITFNDEALRLSFFLLMIYYCFMTLIINFINLVNKKYGPGVVVPLLLGYYRKPREEERIFMFMDLKSSTATAEKLGHLKYSSFIRDCFSDINEILYPHRAQVYQYVGDEIVVTWPEEEGLKDESCIKFYFACKAQFETRSLYYLTNYGFLPEFKAGLHTGPVTAVEIGDVKRDIAYHGDTLNTAARIQSVCNEFQRSFLVSEDLFNKIGRQLSMTSERLGSTLLKGKTAKVGIVSVNGWTGVLN
jgi:adenylate cyclase